MYASPEIVKGTPYQGPEVDCWSLGVLLYTLVYGAMPFDGSNFKRLVKQISAGDYYEPKKASPASPLIKEMLTVCPKRRATIEQICNHWWVNLGYPGSCLDLAEELANQTPVRLDVLLSLTPSAVTSDQLVVPGTTEETKPIERVARSHSVGSIREHVGNTEAERRILDMVAAGGEAALAPSPTRTITPSESPAQPKRKLETTVSTENAIGVFKKKDKPADQIKSDMSMKSVNEIMEIDPESKIEIDQPFDHSPIVMDSKNLNAIEEICNELLNEESVEVAPKDPSPEKRKVIKKKIIKTDSSVADDKPAKKSPTKIVKKVIKTKTTELPATEQPVATEQPLPEQPVIENEAANVMESKSGTPPEEYKTTERRKSRIFEAAEKFQNINANNNDKQKKIVIPGVSVGNFKKEFERKASLTNSMAVMPDRKCLEKRGSDSSGGGQSSDSRKSSIGDSETVVTPTAEDISNLNRKDSSSGKSLEESATMTNFSLEEARKSMENSIALLNQAKTESNKELDQLCAKTENVAVSDDTERLKKIKNAREIIGNAIPVGRLSIGKYS